MLLLSKTILHMIHNAWDSNFSTCFRAFSSKLNVWSHLFTEVSSGKHTPYAKCSCYAKVLKVETNILHILDHIIASQKFSYIPKTSIFYNVPLFMF